MEHGCTFTKKIYYGGVVDMKKIIAVLTLVLCMAVSSSPVFARGYGHHGGHGGHYYGYRGGHHHYGHDGFGLGIAAGIAGGLLGSALIYSAAPPPPPTVVYGAPYPAYPPAVVVQPPRICLEDRLVNGEWQVNKYGNQVWVPYQYPVTQRVQVPCY